MCLGILWGRFGMVWIKSDDEVETQFLFLQKCLGVFFPHRAAPNNHFGIVPGGKYQIIEEHMFELVVYYFVDFLYLPYRDSYIFPRGRRHGRSPLLYRAVPVPEHH